MQHSVDFGSTLSGVAPELLVQLVERSPMPLVLADTDYAISYVNAAALCFVDRRQPHFRCRSTALIGRSLDSLCAGITLPAILSELPARRRIGLGMEEIDLLVHALRDADGRCVGAAATWIPILAGEQGDPSGVVRPWSEEEIDPVARILCAHAFESFSTRMAHDLIQPLSAIANYAQACVESARSEHPDVAVLTRRLEKLIGQVEAAGGMIRRLQQSSSTLESRRARPL